MTDNVISTKLRILTPDDGMALTDGSTYTTGSVYLAHSADASKWREIPASEVPEEATSGAPRRWTRLSIKTALAQRSMLESAREYLSHVEIEPGYDALEALTDCDYVEEGYPSKEKWESMLDGAAAALGKDRSEIDAFLDMLPQS